MKKSEQTEKEAKEYVLALRLERSLWEAIQEAAKDDDRTASEYARRVLKQHLSKAKK